MNRPRATSTSNYGWDSLQYFAKSTDLSAHSQEDLNAFARQLNGRRVNTRTIRARDGSEARSRLSSAPPPAKRKLMTSYDWTEQANQPLLTVHQIRGNPRLRFLWRHVYGERGWRPIAKPHTSLRCVSWAGSGAKDVPGVGGR